jgi:hypothetical protein
VLASLAELLSYKLAKSARVYIRQIYDKAVATGARNLKEKLLTEFRTEVSVLEEEMPVEDEDIHKEYLRFLVKAVEYYATVLANLMDIDTVRQERKDLISRLEVSYRSLLDDNLSKSHDYCKQVYLEAFSEVRALKHMSPEQMNVLLKEAVDTYTGESKGPCADRTFVDNFDFLKGVCLDVIQASEEAHAEALLDVTRQLNQVKLQLKEAKDICATRENELENVHEERTSILESQGSLKDVTESLRAAVRDAEKEAAEASRQAAAYKLELEHVRGEVELMKKSGKDIYEVKAAEYEQKLKQLRIQLQSQQTESQATIDRLVKEAASKDKQLDTFKSKADGGNFNPEASLLANLQDYLDEILANFAVDYTARAKSVTLMEQMTRAQADLDNSTVSEAAGWLKTKVELQLQIIKLKNELESQQETYSRTLDRTNAELAEALASVSHDIERRTKRIVDLEERIIVSAIQNYERANEQLYTTHNNLTKQIDSQYEVVDSYRKTIESQRQDIDDKNMNINTLKYEIVARDDDIDCLLELLGASLDIKTRKIKASLKPQMSRVHTPKVKTRCEQILASFGLQFT